MPLYRPNSSVPDCHFFLFETSSNTSVGGSSSTWMPGKSARSLTSCGRVLYAHSTICSKLSGSVAKTMGQLYQQDKPRENGTGKESRRDQGIGLSIGGEKLRVPRWCCVRSSRPVARVRPLRDLLCRFPRGRSACDQRLGSGLTANRKNLLNASELYPAFDWASRSPRPALCYRPLLAFSAHLAM
jgi:hypothetical protein